MHLEAREFLAIGQIPIANGVLGGFLLIDFGDAGGVDGDQFIFFVKVAGVVGAPFAVLFGPEVDEATVGFGVGLDVVVEGEALGDGGFHFGDGARAFGVDVGGHAVHAVHDEGAFVHAGLALGWEG